MRVELIGGPADGLFVEAEESCMWVTVLGGMAHVLHRDLLIAAAGRWSFYSLKPGVVGAYVYVQRQPFQT